MAEYSVSSPMYSVEGEAIEIEQDKDLEDISAALKAAEGAVAASQRTVKDINQANEDEIYEALVVA